MKNLLPKKILVVEDDKKILAALTARLAAAGYEVLTAHDGLEGIKQAVACKPDLIIMDIWMPVGLGFSVAQRLRQLALGYIPVIFMTASKLKRLRRTAERLGAAAFIEKPYKPQELLSAIAAALHPNWAQDRLHSPQPVGSRAGTVKGSQRVPEILPT